MSSWRMSFCDKIWNPGRGGGIREVNLIKFKSEWMFCDASLYFKIFKSLLSFDCGNQKEFKVAFPCKSSHKKWSTGRKFWKSWSLLHAKSWGLGKKNFAWFHTKPGVTFTPISAKIPYNGWQIIKKKKRSNWHGIDP